MYLSSKYLRLAIKTSPVSSRRNLPEIGEILRGMCVASARRSLNGRETIVLRTKGLSNAFYDSTLLGDDVYEYRRFYDRVAINSPCRRGRMSALADRYFSRMRSWNRSVEMLMLQLLRSVDRVYRHLLTQPDSHAVRQRLTRRRVILRVHCSAPLDDRPRERRAFACSFFLTFVRLPFSETRSDSSHGLVFFTMDVRRLSYGR